MPAVQGCRKQDQVEKDYFKIIYCVLTTMQACETYSARLGYNHLLATFIRTGIITHNKTETDISPTHLPALHAHISRNISFRNFS